MSSIMVGGPIPDNDAKMGAVAQAALRHRYAALSELQRRQTQDHRRHPATPSDREDPDSTGPGSAATNPRASARGGARLRRLSRTGRHRRIRTGCAVPPQRAWRWATRQLRSTRPRVKPKLEAEIALGVQTRPRRAGNATGNRYQRPAHCPVPTRSPGLAAEGSRVLETPLRCRLLVSQTAAFNQRRIVRLREVRT